MPGLQSVHMLDHLDLFLTSQAVLETADALSTMRIKTDAESPPSRSHARQTAVVPRGTLGCTPSALVRSWTFQLGYRIPA